MIEQTNSLSTWINYRRQTKGAFCCRINVLKTTNDIIKLMIVLLHVRVKMRDDCTLFLLPTSAEPKSTRPFYTLPHTVQGMGEIESL